MNYLYKVAVLGMILVAAAGAQSTKFSDFMNSFHLNYSVELGVMPAGKKIMLYNLNGLNLYANTFNTSFTTYSDLEFEVTFKKIVFLDGGMTSYQISSVGNPVNFAPVRMDFPFGIGLRYKKVEVGYYYSCFHPVYPNTYFEPVPNVNAAIYRIYIKYNSAR